MQRLLSIDEGRRLGLGIEHSHALRAELAIQTTDTSLVTVLRAGALDELVDGEVVVAVEEELRNHTTEHLGHENPALFRIQDICDVESVRVALDVPLDGVDTVRSIVTDHHVSVAASDR